MKLRTDFDSRDELIGYLRETFPNEAAHSPEIADTQGGRKAAEAKLAEIDPQRYTQTRNSLDGAVTKLSRYLRHGVLTLREVRLAAIEKAGRAAEKLVNELAWREYWQRVYGQIGDGIWSSREDYKTGFRESDYADELPQDLAEGKTGLVCMDSFSDDLQQTGYLHNHARLWTAAYLVHHRRVKWQAGAHWFLEHLLDGDPASNNLSWQWVSSTFASKPYFFDKGNLERYTDGQYCQVCPLNRGGCPFNYSIPDLQARLFPNLPPAPPEDFRSDKGGRRRGR